MARPGRSWSASDATGAIALAAVLIAQLGFGDQMYSYRFWAERHLWAFWHEYIEWTGRAHSRVCGEHPRRVRRGCLCCARHAHGPGRGPLCDAARSDCGSRGGRCGKALGHPRPTCTGCLRGGGRASWCRHLGCPGPGKMVWNGAGTTTCPVSVCASAGAN